MGSGPSWTSEITKLDSDHSAIFAKAKTAWVAGRTAETRELLKTVVKASPGFVPAVFLAGKAAFFSKDYVRAAELLENTRRLQPSNLEAIIWLAQTRLQIDKDAEAESMVSEALAANPDEPRLSFLMATIYEKKDNLAGALGFLQAAERLEEDLGLIYLESARLRWRLGQNLEARLRLEKAKSILPVNSSLTAPVDTLLEKLAADDKAAKVRK